MEDFKYDFFISHRSVDYEEKIKPIVEHLRAEGAICWSSSDKAIKGGMAHFDAIPDAIKHSRKFLVFMTNNVAERPREIERELLDAEDYADERDCFIQSIHLEKTDIFDKNNEKCSGLRHQLRIGQFINIDFKEDPIAIADEIIKNNKEIFDLKNINKERQLKSTYVLKETEKKRLQLQSDISIHFNQKEYNEVFSKYDEPKILDLGCGYGMQLIDRLNDVEKYKLIGVDHSERGLDTCLKLYQNDFRHYYKVDIDTEDFIQQIEKIMANNNIEKFDIINISFLLRHIKKKDDFIYKLKTLLANNGTIIVIDFDEQLQIAYPDENGYFKKIFKMFSGNTYSGDQTIGRRIYKMLYDAQYNNIKLKTCCTSNDYTPEEMEKCYTAEISYLKDNLKELAEEKPNEKTLDDITNIENYNWYVKNEETIKKQFLSRGFFYLSGWFMYIANK